jgi:hypothetical protein
MIKEAIDGEKVATWKCDSDGDFTHNAEQWNRRAWFRPKVEKGRCLIFSILPPKNTKITRSIYGIYHGRFVEMLLVHFDSEIERVSVSSFPESGDRVG